MIFKRKITIETHNSRRSSRENDISFLATLLTHTIVFLAGDGLREHFTRQKHGGVGFLEL